MTRHNSEHLKTYVSIPDDDQSQADIFLSLVTDILAEWNNEERDAGDALFSIELLHGLAQAQQLVPESTSHDR
jgi:hypothetical protein